MFVSFDVILFVLSQMVSIETVYTGRCHMGPAKKDEQEVHLSDNSGA